MTLPPTLTLALSSLGVVAPKPKPAPRPITPAPWTPKRPGEDSPF